MRRVIAGLGLTLAVAACGTTVPQAQLSGQQTGLDGSTGSVDGSTGGTGAGGSTGATGTSTGLGGTITGVGGSTSGGTTGTGGSTGQGTTGTTALPTAPAGSLGTARGVTPTTITIGAAVATGTEALASAFGISGGTGTSASTVIKAAVDDINLKGGILGRKVNVYIHEFDASAAIADPVRTYAEICSDFRDDHKVFAVLFDLPDPTVRKCLAEMGSPLIVTGSFAVIPRTAFAAFGGSYLYGVNSLTTERLAELFIESLVARDFHQKWNTTAGAPGGVQPTKLGLIHVNTPDQNALYAAYAKELKKRGLSFSQTVVYAQDASAALASTQNAVLKFQTEGITHVYGASAFFLRAAENQNYRPRYAYLPGLGKLGADNSPAAQMRGALTVGWTPVKDVGVTEDPGDTAARAQCRAMMKKAGINTADRTNQGTIYAVCDSFLGLRAALTAGGQPTVAGLRRGYESLGSRFATANTFSVTFSPSQHSGVDSVRDMAYDSSCSCLKYTSRTNRR